ncbi:MAG: indole-3-glycerol phosphate synthase TrpC [Hormoscilla sp. SP5CHS1]|nr:indole-3-glycerol phosphate synthase TrpC [Hormoscilla sp. SP12CHS1]MBC6454400.1 indole-3-glycerol phosphate synthase TrpC [Hormoscilla sp. SP5CHS1]
MQIRRRSPSPPVDLLNLRYEVTLSDSAPQNILEEIVWHKEKEIDQRREKLPLSDLKHQVEKAPAYRDFVGALRRGKTSPALIAEVKKASPSKGVIREDFDPVAIAHAYQQGGATCLSVLTDAKFFQGSFENLGQVRNAVDLPLLCKEFIIYPYQIYLARIYGADAVLLIAAILSDRDMQYFVKIAKILQMTPLIEVHSLAELDRVLALKDVTIVGINNRNLEDFSLDLQTTCQLLEARGQILQARGILVVSESGLHTAADLKLVGDAGAAAVLIGESLVKQPEPGKAIGHLFP